MNIDDSRFEGMDWLKAELEDTLDEDYELEMSEPALSMELRRIYKRKYPATKHPGLHGQPISLFVGE